MRAYQGCLQSKKITVEKLTAVIERLAMRTSMVRERTVDSSEIKVAEKEVCIDVDGKEISLEEARKKIGTAFTGKDGKLYKYILINNSAKKTDIEFNLIRTQYSKLQAVAVDEDGQELADTRVEPTVYTATDFLKKSSMSINLMSLILEQMLNLKLPLNRISQYLSRYGVRYSRQ